MKKWISMVLVLMLLLSLQVPALAAEVTTPGTSSGNVVVNVTVPADEVYSVTINWANLDAEFTYNFGKWNPENRTYDAGGWGANKAANASAEITVSNSSNVDITITAALSAGDDTVEGVTAALANGSFDLAKPAVGAAAISNTMTVTVSGIPENQENTEDQVIKKVVIQIAKDTDPGN